MSTFEPFSGIRETVPAWVECRDCYDGTVPLKPKPCPSCQGAGGAWSDAYKSLWADEEYLVHADDKDKDLDLTREWALCSKCEGQKYLWQTHPDYRIDHPQHNMAGEHGPIKNPCPRCHKDEQGKPTGCEPGTQGGWEVKR